MTQKYTSRPKSRALLLLSCLACNVLADDVALRGYWPLREGTGKRAIDQSANQRHGTVAGKAQWVGGDVDIALYFDGGESRVEIPHDPELNLTEALTMEAWVALAAKGRTAPIVGKGEIGRAHV